VKKSKSSPEKKKINKPKPQTKEKLSKPQEKVVKAVPSNDGGDDQKKTETKVAPKKAISESRAKINEAKKECTNLKRRITRLYKKCVEEIKNMTAENLPRKSKKGAKSKVSIIVPDGKKTGDKISFK
jgi:vacuolar-type H+-ATPase subunit E/Vma4